MFKDEYPSKYLTSKGCCDCYPFNGFLQHVGSFLGHIQSLNAFRQILCDYFWLPLKYINSRQQLMSHYLSSLLVIAFIEIQSAYHLAKKF